MSCCFIEQKNSSVVSRFDHRTCVNIAFVFVALPRKNLVIYKKKPFFLFQTKQVTLYILFVFYFCYMKVENNSPQNILRKERKIKFNKRFIMFFFSVYGLTYFLYLTWLNRPYLNFYTEKIDTKSQSYNAK